ncbi:hypothetical protein [Amycolatopsis sp. RTGN1]|uniref:hypothetical protein n=1 Tax=Amycolatopsis ponsaeliensis TaxID=2992142 RepID=UPI00254CD06A|nr:hypothetical protein [Amycolatopsis sp. RTGN1]
MPAVLTAASTLVCPHGFPMLATPGAALVTVDGNAVLVGADLLNATFACTVATPETKPCTKVGSIDAGLSGTLWIRDEQAALATALGTTDGVPPTPWHVTSAGQTKLEAT